MKHGRSFAWTIYINKKVVNDLVKPKFPGLTNEHIDFDIHKKKYRAEMFVHHLLYNIVQLLQSFFHNYYVNYDLHAQ